MAALCTTMKDHRDQDEPFSADSKRNVPGWPWASLRYTPSGVSPSASSVRVTGITRRSVASERNRSLLGCSWPLPASALLTIDLLCPPLTPQ